MPDPDRSAHRSFDGEDMLIAADARTRSVGWRLVRRRSVTVGTDRLRIEGLPGERFVAYAAIRAVETGERGISLRVAAGSADADQREPLASAEPRRSAALPRCATLLPAMRLPAELRRRLALAAIASGLAGCNLVLGIDEGRLGATGTSGAGAAGGGTGAGGQAGGGQGGGDACPPEPRCVVGACAPQAIGKAEAGDEVVSLVVVGEDVIWSTNIGASLWRTRRDGGGPAQELAQVTAPFTRVTSIATDGDFVYFTDETSARVGRASITTGVVEPISEVTEAQVPMAAAGFARIAVGGGHVYWTLQSGNGVWRAQVTGGPAERMAEAVTVFSVATDDAFVYWGDRDAGTIRRLGFGALGTVPETVATEQYLTIDVFVRCDRVFWATESQIFSALKEGSDRGLLPHGTEPIETPFDVISDGRDVYWTTTGYSGPSGGALRRTPVAGGAVETLATNAEVFGFAGLADDCASLYYLDGGAIDVKKLRK